MFKNTPAWLYEPLPYLYVAMGLVSIVMLEAVVGKLSGVMLISAGVAIWHLRFSYRRRRSRPVPLDLSWGHHQRMHPPKGKIDTLAIPKPKRERPVEDPDDF